MQNDSENGSDEDVEFISKEGSLPRFIFLRLIEWLLCFYLFSVVMDELYPSSPIFKFHVCRVWAFKAYIDPTCSDPF